MLNRRGFFRGLLAAALAPAIKFFPAAKPPQVEFIDTEFGRVALCDQPQSTDTGFMQFHSTMWPILDEEDYRYLNARVVAALQSPQANGGGATRKP